MITLSPGKALFLIGFLCALQPAGAQTWEKTYVLPGDATALFVEPVPGGGYNIVGTSLDFSAGVQQNSILLRINEAGTLLSSHLASSPTGQVRNLVFATTAGDGGFLLSGYGNDPALSQPYALIIRLNASGNALWEYTLPGTNRALQIAPHPAGGSVALLRDVLTNGPSMLVRLNDNGAQTGAYTLDLGGGTANGLTVNGQGDVWVVGHAPAAAYTRAAVWKIDNQGQVTATYYFDASLSNDGFVSVEERDGVLSLGGSTTVTSNRTEALAARMTTDGVILSSHTFGSWRFDQCNRVLDTGNGLAAVGLFGTFWGSGNLLLGYIDDSGAQLEEKHYGGEKSTQGFGLTRSPDHLFVAVGSVFDDTGQDFYAVKTDFIVSTRQPAPAPARLVITPNPAEDFATVTLDATRSSRKMQLQLLDVAARSVRTERWSGNGHRLERKNLPAGLYRVLLTDKTGPVAVGEILFR